MDLLDLFNEPSFLVHITMSINGGIFTEAKNKARHDKHHMEHSFQVGDQVWLYISKDKMQGEGKNLKPIRYGTFKILEKNGENVFCLDLPAYMHIYSIVNANWLRLFEPSLIEDLEE